MKPTVRFGDTTIDGETFFARTLRAASALASAGIGPGDRFGLMLRNEPITLELMMAAWWSGARWVPINFHFKRDETAAILRASGARVLIAHADLAEGLEAGRSLGLRCFAVDPQPYTRTCCGLAAASSPGIERWAAWSDSVREPPPAQSAPGNGVFFTSGTTGPAKGVLFELPKPEQVQAAIANASLAYGIVPGQTRLLQSAPLYHSGPCWNAIMAALTSAEIVLEPNFDAETTLQRVQQHRISHLYLVPAMFVRLLRLAPGVSARYDLSSMRFVLSMGSPCPSDVKRRMIDWWGPVINEAYGASETSLMTFIGAKDALRKPGSVGRPLPGVTVRVLDDEGHNCTPGQVGLIHVHNAALPAFTYMNDPAARLAAERDGLVTLGDVGCLDEDGFLYIVDRRADVVNSSGTKIHTPEVEATLLQLDGVADAAVFGVPDDEFGQVLVAAVQPLQGAALSPVQVQTFLRERLASFKVPRHISFRAVLPREDSGKLFKRRLRDEWVASSASGTPQTESKLSPSERGQRA